MRIEEDVLLSALTTFNVGGRVRFVAHVESAPDICEAQSLAATDDARIVVLGLGSNVLAPDEDTNTVILKVADVSLTSKSEGDTVTLSVGAGVVWDELVAHAVTNDWWGIENLSSIPGTVGGAVVQNIGAYGAVISDCVADVTAYDLKTGELRTWTRDQCAFGYRTSIFKSEDDRYVVLRVTLALSTIPSPKLLYKDLAQYFAHNKKSTLRDIRHAVQSIRATKFPPLAEYGTAGSFFLNPTVGPDQAARIQKQYPLMPVFVLPEGGIKIPLAWFLEHVVQVKGMRDGYVHVWREHALVIATDTGATAAEIKQFVQKISDRTYEAIGIKIFPEVRFLKL